MMAFEKHYKTLLTITAGLGLLVFFCSLGSLPLLSLNEGRRALAIKEMFLSGDWLLPTQHGALYLTKPPLLYWLSVSFSTILGAVNEWTLRLPSALAASASVLMVYQYCKRHFGIWPALFAAQLLIANAGFAMLARRVEIEMLLSTLCLGALLAALHYALVQARTIWIYLSYALLGLAVLTKGPVALLFVTLPLLIAAIWTKDTRIKAVLINKTGWLIFLLVALSWYAAVSLKLGWHIWSDIAHRDLVNKMQGEDNVSPLLSYFGWIAVDFLLLIGLLLIKPKPLWLQNKHNLAFLIPVISIVVAILLFSAFSNKHAKYLLPIYPLIAIVLAQQIDQLFKTAQPRIKLGILVLGVLLPAIFAAFYVVAEAKLFDYRVAMFKPLQAWTQTLNAPLYVLEGVDDRVIYYAQQPVEVISPQQLAVTVSATPNLLLLAEAANQAALMQQSACVMKTFAPYLKKHKKLFVFGFGAHCAAKSEAFK